MSEAKLPVHGFVLAGGKSSRMGEDKALLRFGGRAMVEIAVETLRAVCEQVGIVGSREDLAGHAAVVPDLRGGQGPAAGIEAGLRAAQRPWAMFLPVDVPLMQPELLRAWALEAMERPGIQVSYLRCGEELHPAVCLLRVECLGVVTEELEAGNRRLRRIFDRVGDLLWVAEAGRYAGLLRISLEQSFANVNTPEDRAKAEAWLAGSGG